MAQRTIETYDGEGNLVETRTYETRQEDDNREAIADSLDQAIAYFGGNYRNWATLSAAQKDVAARNAQRALAQIARLLRGRFDATD